MSLEGRPDDVLEADGGARAMTEVERLADFVVSARFEQLSEAAVEQLKIRILDSLGCAIGALDAEPTRLVRELVDEVGGAPLAVLIGGGAIRARSGRVLQRRAGVDRPGA